MMCIKRRTFVLVSVVIAIILSISVVEINSSTDSVLSSRDKSLDIYEETSIWVMQDMRDYLTMNSNSMVDSEMANSHMTIPLEERVFPYKGYNAALYPHYTHLSFINYQYSLLKDGEFTVWLLASATNGLGDHVDLNILVFINNNKIYNVVFY